MRPPRQSQVDFERIGDFAKYDEWVNGVISKIDLRENHRTGFKDEKTGADKYADQVRFAFTLNGAKYPHYSRWTTYSYGEKANLYLKYLKFLVENAQPDLEFDLDLLKGLPVKTMWSQNGDFDNIEQIRPVGAKVSNTEIKDSSEPPAEAVDNNPEDEVGF